MHQTMSITRALRAPYALHLQDCILIFATGHNKIVLLATFTWPVVRMSTSMDKSCTCNMGTVDGCGYDDQQKYTICDTCRQCHSILSILKPIFLWIRQICCIYNSLRYLDRQIWQFLCPQWQWQWRQQRWQNRFLYPCACTRGNNCTYACVNCHCRASGEEVCTMAKVQSCTRLESLMRECGSTEDQQVSHLCIIDWGIMQFHLQ